jgi:transposase
VHGWYERTLADLPIADRALVVRLRVRRFRCTDRTCPRVIFAERFPGLAGVRARRTDVQRQAWERVGFALGGRAGARLARPLRLAGSRPTILRFVHAVEATPLPTTRVLGVDDWARKRGQTDSTILVDLEQHRVVDFLDDRSADAFATWLRDHPGVAVIARDRGGAYADGARQGAPDAVQVADRFHLLANIGEVLERVLARKRAALRDAAAVVNRPHPTTEPAAAVAPVSDRATVESTRPVRARAKARADRATRLGRYEAVLDLHRQGFSQKEIARRLEMGRNTVRRFLHAGAFPERASAPRTRSILDPYEPYLRERWTAGCHNSLQLWREIRARGFAGAASLVRRFVAAWRPTPGRRGPPARSAASAAGGASSPPATPFRVPSPRQARWLLLRPREQLRREEQVYRDALLERDLEIPAAHALAEDFGDLIRTRDDAALAPWLKRATDSALPEFRTFVTFLDRDRSAVEAALTTEWSNGQVEGQINRVKYLKRQMYGRASLGLLKARVLARP